MRILLVEDNEEISEAMAFYCGAKKDIDCEVINNGQEGLERIRNDEFDLILLDIAMPEFSGGDVIEALKQDRLIESKKIVIFTASSNRKLFDENEKRWCQGRIQKTLFVRRLNRVDREIPSQDVKVRHLCRKKSTN